MVSKVDFNQAISMRLDGLTLHQIASQLNTKRCFLSKWFKENRPDLYLIKDKRKLHVQKEGIFHVDEYEDWITGGIPLRQKNSW